MHFKGSCVYSRRFFVRLLIGIGYSRRFLRRMDSESYLHNVEEGSWWDGTCSHCDGKATHAPYCSIRKDEREALEDLEVLKLQDEIQQRNLVGTQVASYPPQVEHPTVEDQESRTASHHPQRETPKPMTETQPTPQAATAVREASIPCESAPRTVC